MCIRESQLCRSEWLAEVLCSWVVCSFVHLQNFEYNILKMSELILMLFTGKRQRSALGTRRSKIEVTQGRRWILEALVDASVSTCLGQVAFFSLAAAINC